MPPIFRPHSSTQIGLTLQALLLQEQAIAQSNLSKEMPDFTPTPTQAEIAKMNHSAGATTPIRAQLSQILTGVYAYDKSVGDDDSSTNPKPR